MPAPNPALAQLYASVTEASWQRDVEETLTRGGWAFIHLTDARRQHAEGWPDYDRCSRSHFSRSASRTYSRRVIPFSTAAARTCRTKDSSSGSTSMLMRGLPFRSAISGSVPACVMYIWYNCTCEGAMPYKDREQQLAYFRERDKRRADYRRAMRPWWDRVKHANDRAKRYGVPGRITIAEMQAVLASGKCHWCGKEGPVFPDHVVPLSRGGINRPENLVPACRSCNARKYTKPTPTAWSTYAARCVSCGATDSRHYARGECTRCAQRKRERRGARA